MNTPSRQIGTKITEESLHLRRLLENGNVEIRCMDKTGSLAKKNRRTIIWSSVFDRYDDIRKSIVFAERAGMDIYTTINPVTRPATNSKLKRIHPNRR